MAERLDALVASIRDGLAGLRAGEAGPALEYYTDYIAEALEAGRTEEEILARLGEPARIIAQVQAEAAVARAESQPGPLPLIRARRGVLKGLAGPAVRGAAVAGASIPYTVAICLYLLGAGAFLAAFGALALTVHEVLRTPVLYALSRVGAAGIGAFGVAVLGSVGLGLWTAARGLTRLTLRYLRRSLRREEPKAPAARRATPSRAKPRVALLVCLATALVGLGLTLPAGLPLTYFSIWNSASPGNLAVRTWTYDPAEVREITATTLNSGITVEVAAEDADVIRVTYEEPEWLAGTVERESDLLSFREASSGRLPYLELVARHEGTTHLRIEVPRGYLARSVTIRSGSGSIIASLPAETIQVSTRSGDVRFSASRYDYGVRAAAVHGSILAAGEVHAAAYESEGLHAAEIESLEGRVVIE